MATVSALYVYPVKSVAGMRVTAGPDADAVPSVTVAPAGVLYDHHFVLLDAAKNLILSSSQFPGMGRATATIGPDHNNPTELVLTAAASDAVAGAKAVVPISAAFEPVQDKALLVDTVSCGMAVQLAPVPMDAAVTAAFKAFTTAIVGAEKDVKLMRLAAPVLSSTNPKDGTLAASYDRSSVTWAPFHVMTEAELAWAAANIDGVASPEDAVRRFRPNVVVSGAATADRWAGYMLGGVAVRQGKLCDRCAIPGVNADGTRLPKSYPTARLRELKGFVMPHRGDAKVQGMLGTCDFHVPVTERTLRHRAAILAAVEKQQKTGKGACTLAAADFTAEGPTYTEVRDAVLASGIAGVATTAAPWAPPPADAVLSFPAPSAAELERMAAALAADEGRVLGAAAVLPGLERFAPQSVAVGAAVTVLQEQPETPFVSQ